MFELPVVGHLETFPYVPRSRHPPSEMPPTNFKSGPFQFGL